MMESVAMSEHRAIPPNESLNFVPKEWPNSYGAQVEEVGQAIVTKIQSAADISNENCDRALALAHKLSMQLRTAEDRISQLEAEVELFRDRAASAERWLQTIQNEIEEKLIAPRSANAAEQTPLPKDAEL
jgi:chromosome segregation ATPase